MTWPDSEVDIDETLVRVLIEEQHADLAGLELRHVGAGFDNSLWRLGPELLVRLPRRQVAVELLLTEQRWLPVLSPTLSLPVPVPLRLGSPSARYTWPWSIVRWIEGLPSSSEPIADQSAAGRSLAGFLKSLHREAPPDAPSNPWRGVALAQRKETFEERILQLRDVIPADPIREVWTAALAAPPLDGQPTWIHGDLHPDNVIVCNGSITGVIDFGDLCAGDPATDLAVAWLLFDDRGRAALLAEYDAHDPGTELRAAGWAALFGLMFLGIGVNGRPDYETIGRDALNRLANGTA